MPDTVTHADFRRRQDSDATPTFRPPGLPSAERPAVSPGLRALCFGAAYGLVIGVLVGVAL